MFNNKDVAIAKLSLRDQQLLELLRTYSNLVSKEEKSRRVVDLLGRDKSQTILKFLAREAASQTAFSFTLWLINAGLVDLDWIYDMVYAISTNPIRQDFNFTSLYESAQKKLNLFDLSIVVAETEECLKLIKLDDLNINDLVLSLDQEIAISLLTWFLSFDKVANVDLSYISEISKTIKQPESGSSEVSEADASGEERSPSVPLPIPEQPSDPDPSDHSFSDFDFEDQLISLNLKLGGTEEELLTRTLDNFLFTKSLDAVSGREQVVFRSQLKVTQYVYNGKESQSLEIKVSSSKSWPPGVYLIQKDEEQLKVMRLPGNPYFEIFPEGPDPYMRALTIALMQSPDSV
jgi:hypothetical protein